MLRSHNCGELRKSHASKSVSLAGWVDTIRTHGNLTFVDIRDRFGKTQVVLNPKLKCLASKLKKEFVIQISGKVSKKGESNKSLKTGDIEVKADFLNIINSSKQIPLDNNATDETRLKYRYLDLRNPDKMDKLVFRHKVISVSRNFFNKNNFLEVETPLLVKPTPEGARDYVVPSRVNKSKFYSLPQSPQLYKQILMISGVDRYYQVAKCLRDEDLRKDRQPEHTQFDFEMSFVSFDDIREFTENLMKHIFMETVGIKLDKFPVFSYDESMRRFGTDKPDLRFGLELVDFNSVADKSDFEIFKSAEFVAGLFVNKEFSRKEVDKYTDLVKIYKAKGLAFMKLVEGSLEGGISKFFSEDLKKKILSSVDKSNLKSDGTFFFVADSKKICQTALGQLRQKLGLDMGFAKKDNFKFCWVKDFPLFSFNVENKCWEPEHHMFSMPNKEFIDNFEKIPERVTGNLWDLVLNGLELGSGSIRISDPKIQERVLRFIGMSKEEAHEKFGFLLHAYEFGGPIHGGMGIGADRLIANILGLDDIRDVIAFPKNKNAQNPMDESPGVISKDQLDELHIKLK